MEDDRGWCMEIMSLLCGLQVLNEMPHKHNSMLVDLQDGRKWKMHLSLRERLAHHTLVPYIHKDHHYHFSPTGAGMDCTVCPCMASLHRHCSHMNTVQGTFHQTSIEMVCSSRSACPTSWGVLWDLIHDLVVGYYYTSLSTGASQVTLMAGPPWQTSESS